MLRRRDFGRRIAAVGALAWPLPWAQAAGAASTAPPLRVLAASDLKFVLTLLLEQFQKATGRAVQVSYGSTGQLARQIQQGLSADLFFAAEEAWVVQLAQAGFTASGVAGGDLGVVYGLGRLALMVPRASALTLETGLDGLRAQWAQVHKFAIANPAHAPYGRAAQEALQQRGLWELVQPKLVLGDNIAQTTQFILQGGAQIGLTAQSLALAPPIAAQSRSQLLGAELHAPLRQRMVLLRQAQPDAQALFDHLQSASARVLWQRYGFAGPP